MKNGRTWEVESGGTDVEGSGSSFSAAGCGGAKSCWVSTWVARRKWCRLMLTKSCVNNPAQS